MRKFVGVGAVVVLVLAFAASSVAKPQATGTVRLAVPKTVDAMAVYVGVKQGIFKSAGLDVQLVPVNASDTAIAAVTAGKADFALTDVVPFVRIATAQTLPMHIAAAASALTNRLLTALVVPASSAVKQGADFVSGSTFGVPNLKGYDQVALTGWLNDEGGIDPTAMNYVVIPAGGMLAALQAGKIAGGIVEAPYLASLSSKDFHVLGDVGISEFGVGATRSVWVASNTFLTKNQGLARKVVAALGDASKYAQLHPQDVQAQLTAVAGWTADQASSAKLPAYTTTLNVLSMDDQAVQLAGFGLTDQLVTVEDGLLWRYAPGRSVQ